MGQGWRAAPGLAMLLVAAAAALASCSEDIVIDNAATNPAELARYLPEGTEMIRTTDVAEVRQELGLPDDADATPIDKNVLRDRESPQSKLFELTSRAFGTVQDAYVLEFDASGSSPLDGTLIQAAAGNSVDLSIVSTSEPFDGVVDKLERTGYSLEDGLYIAGPDTPKAAYPVVADGAGGKVVFADSKRAALRILRRIEEGAEPGPAAEALHAVGGSVKLATTFGRSRCVEALAAAQAATGKGAIMAFTVSGAKPDPDRFDPRMLKGLDTGTTSVLVDSLLVPFNIKRPASSAAEPIDELFSYSGVIEVRAIGRPIPATPLPSPADAYECP